MGRSKSRTFAYIKDRIWQRIQGWKEKFLSWAGKDILIKAVAQVIPTYAMGCFDLTKSFCDQMSKMICRYWWNQQEGKHKIHWVSWELMIKPKKYGGLGFRNIHGINMAISASKLGGCYRHPTHCVLSFSRQNIIPENLVWKHNQGMELHTLGEVSCVA